MAGVTCIYPISKVAISRANYSVPMTEHFECVQHRDRYGVSIPSSLTQVTRAELQLVGWAKHSRWRVLFCLLTRGLGYSMASLSKGT